MKHLLGLTVLAALTAGCRKDRTATHPGAGDAPAAVPPDAPPPPPVDAPPPPPFTPAAARIQTPELHDATFDWNRRVLTPDELERELGRGDAEDVAAARARLGTFVLSLRDSYLDPWDRKTGAVAYRGPGLRGLDLDPPVSFTDQPSVTRGEMPLGGHVSFDTGYLHGTIAVTAEAAAALRAGESDDPMITQYLLELRDSGRVEDVTIVHATLLGVRVVRLGAREQYLEGKPAAPLRAAP